MLFKTDTLFGHVIEDTDDGPVYQDDGSKVDGDNPRPCLGCKVKIQHGEQDPENVAVALDLTRMAAAAEVSATEQRTVQISEVG